MNKLFSSITGTNNILVNTIVGIAIIAIICLLLVFIVNIISDASYINNISYNL